MYDCIIYILYFIFASIFPVSDLPLLSIDTKHISLVIVSIETRCGLEGPGIEFRWKTGTENETRPDRPWGPSSLLHNRYQVIPVGKGGQGVALTALPHLAPRLKKR